MPSRLRTTRTQPAPTTCRRNKVVPWPTRRGRNMHRHISRRLHPLHASHDARRPQGRVAAERAASEQAKQQKPHRPPLHHLSRSKSRRPGTTTFEFVFYSAAAIKFDQLKSPGLSSCRSSFTSCFTSSASMSPQRLCCTAPALRFLATPKHGSFSGSPHCCCSLPNQA